jgi:sulfur carrier protein
VTVHLNGEAIPLPDHATVADLLRAIEVDGERGVAVAVNAEVVPRGEWGRFEIPSDARVEVLSAMQGG